MQHHTPLASADLQKSGNGETRHVFASMTWVTSGRQEGVGPDRITNQGATRKTQRRAQRLARGELAGESLGAVAAYLRLANLFEPPPDWLGREYVESDGLPWETSPICCGERRSLGTRTAKCP